MYFSIISASKNTLLIYVYLKRSSCSNFTCLNKNIAFY